VTEATTTVNEGKTDIDEQVLGDLEALRQEELADEQAAPASGEEAEEARARLAAEEAAEPHYQAGAQMAVGFMEAMLTMAVPYVAIDPAAKEQVAAKLVPVMKKHGGGMPGWMMPYKEELELGMVLVGVGFGVLMQVRAHKLQETKGKPAKAGEGEGEGEEGREPASNDAPTPVKNGISLVPPGGL
jgi:hypothetical protein